MFGRYRNVPKFSDRKVWANSIGLDQISLFAISSAPFERILDNYSIFGGVRILRTLTVDQWAVQLTLINHFCHVYISWAASWQNQQNNCAPSEDSDELGHLPSLISLRCVLSGYLRTQAFFMWTAKTAGHTVILLVLSWCGSFLLCLRYFTELTTIVRVVMAM